MHGFPLHAIFDIRFLQLPATKQQRSPDKPHDDMFLYLICQNVLNNYSTTLDSLSSTATTVLFITKFHSVGIFRVMKLWYGKQVPIYYR